MAELSSISTTESRSWGKAISVLTEKAVDPTPTLDSQRYLVASPYTEREHLLDLETLSVEGQILSQALAELEAVRDDYATATYVQAFNWDAVMQRVRELAAARQHNFQETSWYIVAFRSQIRPTTAYPDLGALDKAAHAEAMASGGFLK